MSTSHPSLSNCVAPRSTHMTTLRYHKPCIILLSSLESLFCPESVVRNNRQTVWYDFDTTAQTCQRYFCCSRTDRVIYTALQYTRQYNCLFFREHLALENNFLVSLFKVASVLCGFYENKREAAHFGSRGCARDERGARALFMSFSWSAEAPPRLLAARQPGYVKLSFVLLVDPTEC